MNFNDHQFIHKLVRERKKSSLKISMCARQDRKEKGSPSDDNMNEYLLFEIE